MHIRKVTKADGLGPGWSLQELASALVALLGITRVFGIDLSDKKAATS